jgi:hypothetical protein
MNDIDIIRLASGLLQLGVAWYVLCLARLFKSTLLGGLLFGALSFAALVSLFLAVAPVDTNAQWGVKVDLVYTLLLLVGLTRFFPGLKTFLQEEEGKLHALDKWESQVKEQWVELIKTNEKLRQTVNRYEAEIAERKQAQEQLQKSVQELLAASRQSENTSSSAAPGLDTEVVVQPPVPTPEPVQTNGANGEHPVTAPPTNGDAPLPVVAGFDTAIITHEPAPEPAEQYGGPEKNGGSETNGELETNGEHLLTPSRNNGEELQPIALAPERKITARKTNRPKRKKPALTRVASRARR